MADIPLHLYGPAGLASFVAAMMAASDTCLMMPVIVHEYVLHPPALSGLSSAEARLPPARPSSPAAAPPPLPPPRPTCCSAICRAKPP